MSSTRVVHAMTHPLQNKFLLPENYHFSNSFFENCFFKVQQNFNFHIVLILSIGATNQTCQMDCHFTETEKYKLGTETSRMFYVKLSFEPFSNVLFQLQLKSE
jgi:hypothetical protein